MKKLTLCFCIKDNQVLLAMKKRGFGVGKWNGYGGKLEEGETPNQAAVREIFEESSIVINQNDLKQVGLIDFFFNEEHKFECYVYIITSWKNDPIETEEMKPMWYPKDNLPFDEMWVADTKWIPIILNDQKIKATVKFDSEGETLEEFKYELAEFN